MFTNIPQIEMVVIDIGEEKNEGQKSESFSFTAELLEKFFGDEKDRRSIERKGIQLIDSEEKLKKYKNAQGNEWVSAQKPFRKKQFYIRHPKSDKRSLLIEAESFSEYIEDEQKEELIDFIFSHCRVKSILIEQIDGDGASLGVDSKVKGMDIKGSAEYGKKKEDYYHFSSRKRLRKKESQKEYLWLDEWVKASICSLRKGSRF